MSARFLLLSLASGGAALIGGVGLGLYATTPPKMAFSYDDPIPAARPVETPPGHDLSGPVDVRCTGCGPTLAERQMAQMMGDWTGHSDPVVQGYEAEQDMPEDLRAAPVEPPPSPVHQLPENVRRFAAGEDQPAPAQMAQGAAFSTATYQAEPEYP